MRIAALLAVLPLLAGCPSASVSTPPTAPALTWTGNGNPGVPTCGVGATTQCLTTYTLTDETTGQVLSDNIPASQLSYVFSALPAAGNHTYELTINGQDQNGNPVASAPATTAVTIP